MSASHDPFKFWREDLKSAKYVLAPMVEQSELPWRMLSRKYGAEVCYTPMLNAGVFLRDKNYRVENFSTCAEDRPLIAQFCSDDPDTFLGAAKLIENECDAIDLNLGCPQHIARRGHYGSFLQDEWELIHSIRTQALNVSKAVQGLKIPVTAKIRVFDDIEKSVKYAKMIESTGISLLTVHGRTREQKGPQTGLASWKHIKAIKSALKIPVLANGNILCFDDVDRCLTETGCQGMMVAESNLYNPALFANLNPTAWDIANEYLDFVEKYPCSFHAIRAHIFKIFHKVFPDMRDKTGVVKGDLKNIIELRKIFSEIKELCLETQKSDGENGLEFYRCQAYIRHSPPDPVNSSKLIEKLAEIGPSELTSSALKRHVEEIAGNIGEMSANEQESAMKLVKVLERKRRKQDRMERKAKYIEENLKKIKAYNDDPEGYLKKKEKMKYELCVCKNPMGAECEYKLCRRCCKEKVHTEFLECKGHKLRCRKLQNDDNTDYIVTEVIK